MKHEMLDDLGSFSSLERNYGFAYFFNSLFPF